MSIILFSSFLYNILIVGDEHIGKSCIVAQSKGLDISNNPYVLTFGIDNVIIYLGDVDMNYPR